MSAKKIEVKATVWASWKRMRQMPRHHAGEWKNTKYDHWHNHADGHQDHSDTGHRDVHKDWA